MELNTLKALLEDQLKDLYSAENQLVKVLPKMARKASSPSLRQAFERHAEETREQIDRLKQIGSSLGMTLGGKKCHAMEGLIEEGNEVMQADGEPSLIDAALVGAAQRTEHYEISAYGTARAMAEHLGLADAARALQQTLDEESETDEELTRISVGELLPGAMNGGLGEERAAGRGGSRRGGTPGRSRPSGGGGKGKRASAGRGTTRGASRSKGRGTGAGASRSRTTSESRGRSTSRR